MNTTSSRRLTGKDVAVSLSVAAAVDLLQVPGNLAFFSALATGIGAALDVPIELSDIGLDIIASMLITRVLGFHWAFLPTCVFEAIPGIDAAPTWVGCVLFVLSQRKREIDWPHRSQSPLESPDHD